MSVQLKIIVFLAMLAVSLAAKSEDIDIYSAIQSDGSHPNLMVLLDNSAAWDATVSFSCPNFTVPANNAGKAVGFEQCALYNAVQSIGSSPALVGNINMGLMLFGAGSTNGGHLLLPGSSPFTMPTMDSAGITAYSNAVASLDRNADKSNGSAVGASMQETWAYYNGGTGLSGTSYSPHFNSACQRNFVVYIANANNFGKPQDQGQTAINALASAGASSAQQTEIDIPSPYDKYQSNWADEWARFMLEWDMSASLTGTQNIVTYTIIVTDGNNPDYVQFLQAMAASGGGKSFVVEQGDMNALVQALLQIFNEVQGVNSAFSSSSLPVSANAQGQYLNQVFMGVFRPAAEPRWQGNLKQYKLAPLNGNSSETILVDSSTPAKDAITSGQTGFISPNAVSFWTSKNTSVVPDSNGGFWVKTPQGISNGYDSADGEVVEKGGAHQQLRLAYQKVNYSSTAEATVPLPATARQLYTCTGCASGASLKNTPFSRGNGLITAANLGAAGTPISISSIKRDDSTQKALVTLAATPSPALSNGQTVTISGASNSAFNGTFTITKIDNMHFTVPFSSSLLTPPTPATGAFSASLPIVATNFTIGSITRSGTTATATTALPHGYFVGQTVAINGAGQSEYNGNKTITGVTANSFTFTVTVTDLPVPPTNGTYTGQAASVGNSGNETFNFTSMVITPVSSTSRTVTITNTASGNTPPKNWQINNSLTISGVDSNFNQSTWKILALNTCPSATNNKSVCFSMPITQSPVSPATGAMTVSTVATAAVSITSLTRGASTCAVDMSTFASTGSVTTVLATATAPSHGFSDGATVSISGTPGTDEGNYMPSNPTIHRVDANTFTYPITVAPPCSEITSGMQATPSGVDKDTLISWLRGEDNAGNEIVPDPTRVDINVRPSVHGDVLHSRPVVINYGLTKGVVAFYGSNDGVYRAVNGNQLSNPSGSTWPAPGNEMWGFVPREFFSKINRLRNNSPQIKLTNTPSGITPTPLPKDYFFDGTTGAYQNTVTDKVYLYLTSRRGGALMYALDVSDPKDPKYLWKIRNNIAGFSNSSGFGELGQTWSAPKVIKVRGYSNPVLVFGGGYDPNEDAQPALGDSHGRAIYMLDAVTGAIVWQAEPGGSSNHCQGTPCQLSDMRFAIPSDISVVDRNRDGYTERLYVGDLGGNVWRVDLEPSTSNVDPGHWQVTLFAKVGGTAAAGADRRKIFYPPSVVSTSAYDAVLVATGDREHPMASDLAVSIKNRLYMLKDTNVGNDGSKAPDGSDWSPIVDDSSTTAFASTSMLFNATSVTYDGSLNGFYLNFVNTGEKAVNAPITVAGKTYFATNAPQAPDPNTCQANLGTARSYAVNFFTGETRTIVFPGGGLPPTAVVANVTLDNGQTRQVCIGCGEGIQGIRGPSGAGNTGGPTSAAPKRSFWYENR